MSGPNETRLRGRLPSRPVPSADVGPGWPVIAGDGGAAVHQVGTLATALVGALPVRSDPSAVSDSATLAASWARDGEKCLYRIHGQWLAVVWDARARTLTCARSAHGLRRLFWRRDADALRYSTDLATLLPAGGPPRPLNEAFLVEMLANAITTDDETPFHEVHRLPAGHVLRATWGGGVSVSRWHSYPPAASTATTHLEAGRELRHRLDTVLPDYLNAATAVLVSGGIDSNAVLALARRAAGPGTRVVGCSLVYPGMPCDESTWVDVADRTAPEPAWRVCAPAYDWSRWRSWSAGSLQPPPRPHTASMDTAVQTLARAGIRTVLTGEGGDDWFGGGPTHWPSMILRGGLAAVWRSARAAVRLPHAVLAVMNSGLGPLLAPPRRPVPPRWVDARAARRVGLAERLRASARDRARAARDPTRARLARLTNHQQTWTFECVRDRFAAHGVDWCHPLHDDRVAAFVLSLPGELLYRAGQPKSLLRAAVADVVPAEIVQRLSKTEYGATFGPAVRAAGGMASLATHPLVREGLVRLDPLVAHERIALARCDAGLRPRHARESFGPLWAVFSTATWLSAVKPAWP